MRIIELIVVCVIVLVCIVWSVSKLIKTIKKGGTCTCGCSNCPQANVCHDKNK